MPSREKGDWRHWPKKFKNLKPFLSLLGSKTNLTVQVGRSLSGFMYISSTKSFLDLNLKVNLHHWPTHSTGEEVCQSDGKWTCTIWNWWSFNYTCTYSAWFSNLVCLYFFSFFFFYFQLILQILLFWGSCLFNYLTLFKFQQLD